MRSVPNTLPSGGPGSFDRGGRAEPGGTVLSANEGLRGHHGDRGPWSGGRPPLCDPTTWPRRVYRQFWSDLRASCRYFALLRRHRSGRVVWLRRPQPVRDPRSGRFHQGRSSSPSMSPRRSREEIRTEAFVKAVERSMLVIEFTPGRYPSCARQRQLPGGDGLHKAGEVGPAPRMFCAPGRPPGRLPPKVLGQPARRAFFSGQFHRVNRRGEPVWLEASYNPVFDLDGVVIRVVKTASDAHRPGVALPGPSRSTGDGLGRRAGDRADFVRRVARR